MSGPLPRSVALAAHDAAIRAEAIHAARKHAPAARAAILAASGAKPEPKSLPGRIWGAMSPQVRTALVMLTLDTPGDPRAIARQPWESLSPTDRAALAATARQFGDECKHARCLW